MPLFSVSQTTRSLLLCLALPMALALWLRGDQWLSQILMDDEWHAVHKLLASDFKGIALSFGHADYSIPLTLLYKALASCDQLSEASMRLPMLVAGVATVACFTAWAWRAIGSAQAVLVGVLFASSPLLINYSRNARPYALTLLLVWCVYGLATPTLKRSGSPLRSKQLWLASALGALCIWLHPITLPLVIAPFAWPGLVALAKRDSRAFIGLCVASLPLIVLTTLAILPPLLSDPMALKAKSGFDLPTLDTWLGAWRMWVGTGSGWVAAVLGIVALVGVPATWNALKLWRAPFALGLLLTLVAVFSSQPQWVHHPLTLARYLLPVLPVILLAIALGFYQLGRWITRALPTFGRLWVGALAALLSLTWVRASPLPTLLRAPNQNTLHTYYQFDYAAAKNKARWIVEDIAHSSWWASRFVGIAPNQYRIAVGPWQFESTTNAQPIWQQLSRQQIIPAFITELCGEPLRYGEVPPGRGVRLRNSTYMAAHPDLMQKGIDFLVLQKAFLYQWDDQCKIMDAQQEACRPKLRFSYGEPVFADEHIEVFDLRPFKRRWIFEKR